MSDIRFIAKDVRPEALAELDRWLAKWGALHDLETELIVDSTRDPLRRVYRVPASASSSKQQRV